MSRSIRILSMAALVLGAAAFYFSPHLTVWAMRAAAKEGNVQKVARSVDFPAVKDSLRKGFSDKLFKESGAGKEPSAYADLGAAIASALIAPALDAIVTPENLGLLIRGEKPRLGTPSPPETGNNDKAPEKELSNRTSMAYEGFDLFVVTVRPRDAGRDPVTFVFRRENLVLWKLSALRMTP
jgi:hypothetical protein